MSFIKLTDLDLAMPTIEHCMKAGAAVMVMSHRGRPEEGKVDEENSMAPIAADMSAKLGREVRLIRDYLDNPPQVAEGEVVLLENVRFNAGEKKNDETLARKYAALCDVFVMDAFGTAHRAQASTHGVAKFAPTAWRPCPRRSTSWWWAAVLPTPSSRPWGTMWASPSARTTSWIPPAPCTRR